MAAEKLTSCTWKSRLFWVWWLLRVSPNIPGILMYFPEPHNSRLFLTHGTTVKSEAGTQHHKGYIILRNGLKELGIFAMKRDLGTYTCFWNMGKGVAPRARGTSPRGQYRPRVRRHSGPTQGGQFLFLEGQLIGHSAELSFGDLCIRYGYGHFNV